MTTTDDLVPDEGSPEDEPDVPDDELPTDEEEAAAPPPDDAALPASGPETEEAQA